MAPRSGAYGAGETGSDNHFWQPRNLQLAPDLMAGQSPPAPHTAAGHSQANVAPVISA